MSGEHDAERPEPHRFAGSTDAFECRESAYDLLRAAEHPHAEEYGRSYEETRRGQLAARAVLAGWNIPAEAASDSIVSVKIPRALWRRLKKKAANCGMSPDEYLRTYIAGFMSAQPSPPPGWQEP